MYTRRVCRMCRGIYITGTDEKGENTIPRNSVELVRLRGFFPASRGSFDICQECYDDFFKRLVNTNKYILNELSDIDKGIVTEYESEQKELPKNEK